MQLSKVWYDDYVDYYEMYINTVILNLVSNEKFNILNNFLIEVRIVKSAYGKWPVL